VEKSRITCLNSWAENVEVTLKLNNLQDSLGQEWRYSRCLCISFVAMPITTPTWPCIQLPTFSQAATWTR